MLSTIHLIKEQTKKYVLCVHTGLNCLVFRLRVCAASIVAVNSYVMSL